MMRLALLACLISGSAVAATLTVNVDGIRPNGAVLIAVCRGGLDQTFCTRGQAGWAPGTTRDFVFSNLAPGEVAVAAFEDLNGNRRLDRTGFGLPLEPYGFSNGAGQDGRPDFNAARFELPDQGATIGLHLVRALDR